MKKICLAIGLVFLTGNLFAQDQPVVEIGEPAIDQAMDTLGAGLSDLKASASKLSSGNANMTMRNTALKAKINEFQKQLGQLSEENNALTRAALKLQDQSPTRTKKITQLEKELFSLDEKMERLAADISTHADAIERAKAEDESLTARLNEIGLKEPAPAPVEVVEDVRGKQQKEKLRLLKMIADSKQKQIELHAKINTAKKNVPVIDQSVSGRKEELQAKIKEAEIELAKANAQLPATPLEELTQEQVKQLEAQVKDLKANHAELDKLMGKMEKKVGKVTLTSDQRMQLAKLKESQEAINIESRKLKGQLADLRQEMVNLDKRKTQLSGQLEE
jgi:chromosome segregation ATPase